MLQKPHEVHAAFGCEGEGRGALDLILHAVQGKGHLVQQLRNAPPRLMVDVVHRTMFHAPPLQQRNAHGIGRRQPRFQLVHFLVPGPGVSFGPGRPEGDGRRLGIGEVHVQDPNGVVVQREQLGMVFVVGQHFAVVHVRVEAAFNVPGLVGVDEEALAVGLKRGVQARAFFLQLGVRLGEHDLFSHPSVDEAFGEGRTVFQAQRVRHPLCKAVPGEHFSVGLRHHVFPES